MITWTITNLLRNTKTGFVQSVFWKAAIVGDDKEYSIEDVCHFVYENNVPHIDYSDLTEEEVLNWVFSRIDKNAVELQLNEKLSKSPSSGLPW